MIVYRINGNKVSRKQWLARKGVGLQVGHAPMGTIAYTESNPLVSEGIGCMRTQVPKMREEIRKHNIKGVRVRDSGQVEITSRRGRRELMEMRGLHDNDGGYGDG